MLRITYLKQHSSVEVLAILGRGVASGRHDVTHGGGTISHDRVHWHGYAVRLFWSVLVGSTSVLTRNGLDGATDWHSWTRRRRQVGGYAFHATQLAVVRVL